MLDLMCPINTVLSKDNVHTLGSYVVCSHTLHKVTAYDCIECVSTRDTSTTIVMIISLLHENNLLASIIPSDMIHLYNMHLSA